MFAKFLVVFAGLVAICSAGLLPAAVPAYAGPISGAYAAHVPLTYATSYNAHAINHGLAAPLVASPLVGHTYGGLSYYGR